VRTSTACKTDMAPRSTPTEMSTSATSEMARHMEKASIHGPTLIFMMGSGIMGLSRATACGKVLIMSPTLESGLTPRLMGMASICGLAATVMKESGKSFYLCFIPDLDTLNVISNPIALITST